MRGYCLFLVLGLCLAGQLAVLAQQDTKSPVSTTQIDMLIQQLGSPSYSAREKARIELEKLGLPALEALKKAAVNGDAEVSQSARKLVEKMEELQQTNTLLAPKMVHLQCKEMQVGKIIEELEKQSGYKIQIQGDSTLLNRRITVDTGKEVPFWQAFDMICEKAGLILNQTSNPSPYTPKHGFTDDIIVPAIQPPPPPLPIKNLGGIKKQAVQPAPVAPKAIKGKAANNLKGKAINRGAGQGFGGAGALQFQAQPAQAQPAVQPGFVGGKKIKQPNTPGYLNQTITVQPGTPAKIPTCYSGSMRVQLLSPVYTQNEVQFTLRVTPEPGTDVSLSGSALVEKATDENGKPLSMVMNQAAAPYMNPYYGSPSYYYNPNMPKVNQVTVKLKPGDNRPKLLKELKGKVNTQMVMPTEPIITVKDVMKAGGKTEKGKDGGYVQVMNIQKDANNRYILQVRVETPPGMNNINGNGMAAIGGGGVIIQGNVIINGQMVNQNTGSLLLLDGKGQQIPFQYQSSNSLMVANGKLTRQMTLVYQASPNQEPDQLILVGRRLATVSIPFHFENVTLP